MENITPDQFLELNGVGRNSFDNETYKKVIDSMQQYASNYYLITSRLYAERELQKFKHDDCGSFCPYLSPFTGRKIRCSDCKYEHRTRNIS